MKKFTSREQEIAARVLTQLIRETRQMNEEVCFLNENEKCFCLDSNGFAYRGGRSCKCGKPEKAVISLLRLVEKNSNMIIRLVQPVRRRKEDNK